MNSFLKACIASAAIGVMGTAVSAACPAPPVVNEFATVIQMAPSGNQQGQIGLVRDVDATVRGALVFDWANNSLSVCDGSAWQQVAGAAGGGDSKGIPQYNLVYEGVVTSYNGYEYFRDNSSGSGWVYYNNSRRVSVDTSKDYYFEFFSSQQGGCQRDDPNDCPRVGGGEVGILTGNPTGDWFKMADIPGYQQSTSWQNGPEQSNGNVLMEWHDGEGSYIIRQTNSQGYDVVNWTGYTGASSHSTNGGVRIYEVTYQ